MEKSAAEAAGADRQGTGRALQALPGGEAGARLEEVNGKIVWETDIAWACLWDWSVVADGEQEGDRWPHTPFCRQEGAAPGLARTW